MIRALIFLILVAALFMQYQGMVSDLPDITLEAGEISIKAYTDRILLTFPLHVRNSGSANVDEISYKIYLDDTYLEEKKIISPLRPGESASHLFEGVTLKNEILDSVIIDNIKKCQYCPPEDMKIKIRVEASLPLHPLIPIAVPKGKTEQSILLRALMGGRTREEYVQTLQNLFANASSQ